MKDFKKWSKHRVGDIKWVNKHRDHPHRSHFIDYIQKRDDISKIVEIGGGEMIEAKELIKDKNINYTVVDVSSSFLENAKKIKRLTCIEASMHDLPFKDKEFDLIYLSSVIEHSPDIIGTIKELSRTSKFYYITMFKWKMKTGGLISQYRNKKKYYSTVFNLPSIISELSKYGDVVDMNVSLTNSNTTVSYEDYKNNIILDADKWRNGDRLNIIGNFHSNINFRFS